MNNLPLLLYICSLLYVLFLNFDYILYSESHKRLSLSVLHEAGPGADEGDRDRLRDEGHLRHVCQTRQQSG